MRKEEVKSVQTFIEEYLKEGQIAHKKGYRTYQISGPELLVRINKIRIFLKSHNIHKGDKIIILAPNSINWVAVYFASILSGLVVVPLDVLTDKSLLEKINKQVKAKAIFTDKPSKSITIKAKKFNLDDLDYYIQDIQSFHLPIAVMQPSDVIEIIYTSGATGEPKGVVLTHENIISGVSLAIKSVPIKVKLKILNLLPLSHIFSQIYGLFFMMYFSHKIFFIDTIQSKKVISYIKNKKIHGTILVPGILGSLKKELEDKPLRRYLGWQFRLIGVGGAPLDIELEKWWRKHLIFVVQGYGMTETSSIISTNTPLKSKIGSVGKIAENIKIKLNPDGEILVKGKNVTLGYYNDELKTAESFENGWFKTGDVGEIINDFLYIRERKKDVIITGSGLKAYPIDIENILNKINGVKESCVLQKDNEVHAILILNKKINPSEIIKIANQKLLYHQKISSFSLWSERDFPKTPTGKIKKFLVKEKISREKAPSYKYEDIIYNLINKTLSPHKKINAQDKLSDLGMDSLKIVELISELEKEFGGEIDETKLTQYTKVRDLEKLIKERIVHEIKFKFWPMNPLVRAIRKISQKVLWYPIIRIFTKTGYYGLHNLENLRFPLILASNHQSAVDPAIVTEKFKAKYAIAAHPKILFGIGVKNPFIRAWRRFYSFFATLFFNTYPFGEEIGIDKSLEFTGEMLDRGYSIIIHPEGARTTDGKIQTFKPGIGYIALNMNVPIVPVRIEGMFHILPRGRKIPRFGKSKVTFGKPIMPDEIKNLSYIQVTKVIEKRVKEL